MVPSRVCSWTRNVRSSCSKRRTQREQEGCDEKDANLGPEASSTKFIHSSLARDDVVDRHERERQEGCDGKVSAPHQLYIPIDPPGIRAQSVESLHRASDQCNKHDDNTGIVQLEYP